VSAPKSLFDRLIEVWRATGLTTATIDEGLLIITSGEQVVGILALHVDDTIGGGMEEFHGMMAKIGETSAQTMHKHCTTMHQTRLRLVATSSGQYS
jgi:hypothetical protein